MLCSGSSAFCREKWLFRPCHVDVDAIRCKSLCIFTQKSCATHSVDPLSAVPQIDEKAVDLHQPSSSILGQTQWLSDILSIFVLDKGMIMMM